MWLLPQPNFDPIIILTLRGHFFNLDPKLVGHEANYAEDDEAGKEAGHAVAKPNQQGIPMQKSRRILTVFLL